MDESSHSNIPTNETCYTCHGAGKGGIKVESPKLAPVRKAAETGKPIEWVRVHAAPDYVYFNHSVHVNRGVSCVSCHGKVNEMEVVSHVEPHSMGWCLNCHRNPEEHLRPVEAVYDLDWKPEQLDRKDFYQGLLDGGAHPADLLGGIEGEKTAVDLPEGVGDTLAYLVEKAGKEFWRDSSTRGSRWRTRAPLAGEST